MIARRFLVGRVGDLGERRDTGDPDGALQHAEHRTEHRDVPGEHVPGLDPDARRQQHRATGRDRPHRTFVGGVDDDLSAATQSGVDAARQLWIAGVVSRDHHDIERADPRRCGRRGDQRYTGLPTEHRDDQFRGRAGAGVGADEDHTAWVHVGEPAEQTFVDRRGDRADLGATEGRAPEDAVDIGGENTARIVEVEQR